MTWAIPLNEKRLTQIVMSEYTMQAIRFAEKVGLKMKVLGYEWEKPEWDKKYEHAKFRICFSRNGKSWTLEFYQSISEGSKKPSIYDVLACVTKYDPGTFENFCSDYGYDEDSRKAERIWKAVKKEFKNVERLFGDVMDDLREIA